MKQIRSIVLLAMILGYLGLCGNRLCIYNELGEVPVLIFPYSKTIFPEKDQDLLEDGIPFSNSAELCRLLENYLS